MTQEANRRWSARRPVWLGLAGLVILLGGFGTWATQTNIAGAIIASGRVEVDQNRQVVQHLEGGVVSKIAVSEGDAVNAGDLLLALDDRQLISRLAIIEGQLFEIMARRGRLEAERDGRDAILFDGELRAVAKEFPDVAELVEGQQRLFLARRESLEQETEQLGKRAGQIENQIDGVIAQQASLSRQLELIEEELESQRTLLARGLAQASRVLALEREAVQLEGRLGELSASQAQAEGRITEIELQKLNLVSRRREEAITQLRDARYRELEFLEQRAALREDIAAMEIRAPVSGVVYGLQVRTPRSVIRPADPLLFLVPQDRPLVIAAQVDPLHIDQVLVGQSVNLRLTSLDQRTTPELVGQVTVISADAFEDTALGLTYYQAEIALKPGELSKLNPGDTLIPGMPVEAFIRTVDRTPMAYLLKPLSDYFTRALRES